MTEKTKLSTQYVMVDSSSSIEQDDTDLLELFRTILYAWKSIFGITIICTGMAVTYALYAPEVFKAETLLAPATDEKSGASSALSQFGGLAAMAGISIPSDSNVEQVVATLQSRKFLRQYIDSKSLLPVFFEEIWDAENQAWLVETREEEPTQQKAVDLFKDEILSVDEDKKSGLINLSISWKDPRVAAEWANDLVKQLNEQLRSKAIADSRIRVGYLEQELAKTTLQDLRAVLYNLLESEKQKAMLANVNEDFALEVIDPAVAPETRYKPKRKLIVALGVVCGGFLGIFAVFFGQFLRKLKSFPSKKVVS
tara:strand:- start:4616 stop:5548 length:933 start_codon:yes stop_codon:yes gene_type:complete